MTAKRIGFIGPGAMGAGIIKNLAKGRVKVTVYAHRKGLPLTRLKKLGAAVTMSLVKLAEANDTIMITVPSSTEVEQLILGREGLVHNLKPGSAVIDFTSSLPSSTKMIAAKLREKKIQLLDAPMTGGPRQAEAGRLNLIVGGKKSVYKKYLPILGMLAANVFHVGPVGAGHTVKLINNFLGQLNNAAIAEALILAVKSGIDLDALFSAISVSGGNSTAFQYFVPRICQRDFGVTFKMKLCHKDIKYISQLGQENNVPLPMVNATLHVTDMAMAHGLGEQDYGSLIKVWEDLLGIQVASKGKPARRSGRGNRRCRKT